MTLRKTILIKLKEKEIDIGQRRFDKYYFNWINDTNYEYSKFDGMLDMIENEDLFLDFCNKVKQYIKDGL